MDWQAKWIWADGHLQTPNFYMYARKEFDVESFSTAHVHITCSSNYCLYINGRYIGRGPSPCHPAFQYYDTYDVSNVLRPGPNVIGAICYNYGVGTHFRPQTPGALLCQVEISSTGNNLEPIIIGSDETWKVTPAAEWDFNSTRMFWTIGFQEVYDSRKKPIGWNVVGFDDSSWISPGIVGEVGCEPWKNLIPRQIPPLRETEVYPERVVRFGRVQSCSDIGLDVATKISKEATIDDARVVKYPREVLSSSRDAAVISSGTDCFIIFDFGREVVGYPVFQILDGGNAVVEVGYSETLDSNGNISPTRQGILQADRLILHGGRQELQMFGRRAFRYLQLTFRSADSPIYIESIYIRKVGYPVKKASSFECSDDLLNKIWEMGAYTLSICMQDHYEDCPLREHGQYVGDARVQALMNHYCYSDSALAAKSLWQFVQLQNENGYFNALWPTSTNHGLPDYNLVWVMMLHDHYVHTRDRQLLERLYPNLLLLLNRWATSQENKRGLLVWEPNPDVQPWEWWLFIDHAPLDKRGEVAAYNAFYYAALRYASNLAGVLNELTDMSEWHARSERVFTAFNDQFWSEESGAYVDCNVDGKFSSIISEQTNYLAISFGLADVHKREQIWDSLHTADSIVKSSGPYFDFYVLQAMARMGKAGDALNRIRKVWGGMIDRGATTWWETFDPAWPEDKICPSSLCHAWSGAPTYFLPAEVLGVKYSGAQGNELIIQPKPGDLQWAKGSINTHFGVVSIEWNFEDGNYTLDIDSPCDFITAIPVDRFMNPQINETDLTPETSERKARKAYGWGNTIWQDAQEHDPYLDWLASQEEDPPKSYESEQRCSYEDGFLWIRHSPSRHIRYEISEAKP